MLIGKPASATHIYVLTICAIYIGYCTLPNLTPFHLDNLLTTIVVVDDEESASLPLLQSQYYFLAVAIDRNSKQTRISQKGYLQKQCFNVS